jgi:hypothetical protein
MIRRHYSIERMPLVNAIALNEIRPFVPKLLQEELLAKRISDKDDPRIPMTGAEFLAKAWKLANNKAGEVGWIKARGWA